MTALITLAFLALAGTALGAMVRPYTGVSFGPDGVGGTESFGRIQAITVDGSGNVYVFDGGTEKIYKFDSAGAPAEFTATSSNAISGVGGGLGGAEYEIAVAPAGSPAGTAGDIYLANNSQEATTFASSGARLTPALPGEGETCGVATDPSGNLYLGVFPRTIRKYIPTANPPKATDVSGAGTSESVCNIAADGAGRIYAARYNGGLFRLSSLADKTPVEIDPSARTMAIQPTTNEVFANRGDSFAEYEPDGTLVGVSGTGELNESHGIGVNAAATKVYAGTTKVKIFGAATLLPDIAIEPVDGIAAKAATFHGSIGAAGGPTASCQFQYVTQEAFTTSEWTGAASAPCDPAGPFTGTSTAAVEAEASGLVAGTEYRVRLLGSSSNGSNASPAETFRTADAVNVAADPATEVTGTGFRANGKVTPEGNAIEACVFEWGTGYEFQNSLPCAESSAEIGTGNAAVAIHADVTGLEPITRYQYRIKVKNSIGTTTSSITEVFTRGAQIFGSPEVEPLDTRAVFSGNVEPNNDPTTFVFEYVSKAEFEASGFDNAEQAPVGGGSAGSGGAEVTVKAEATDLQPNTDYAVRLSVFNPARDDVSGVTEFRTFSPSTAGIPDGRAYEQVTPVTPFEKNGNSMNGSSLNVQYASPDGKATTYYAVTGAGNTESSIQYPVYIARRGAETWSSSGFNLPADTGNFVGTLGYTEDLSGGYAWAQTPGITNGLYLHEFANNKVYTIMSGIQSSLEATTPAAETSDGEQVLIESPAKKTADAIEGKPNLYLWTKSTGQLNLVSVLPDGSSAEGAWAGPWDYWNEVQNDGGNGASYYTQHTLSRDGSKVFFTAKPDYQVYMRSNPLSSSAATTLISASQKTNGTGPGGTDPEGVKPADWVESTPSGSFVFIRSSSELTNDANTGNADQGADLYRYDTSSGELIDVAPDPEGDGTRYVGLLGSSDDGRRAYFVARGDLAEGAQEGERNIYLWQEGKPLQFIATMIESFGVDEEDYLPLRYTFNFRDARLARVDAAGNVLTFMSNREQPGYPNPRERAMVYRWEIGGSLLCLSCNPTGNVPRQNAALTNPPTQFIRPNMQMSITTRNLSPDGKRMFFSTAEALTANDVNGVEDVYEWEAKGKGSCDSEAVNGGCLYLISTGTSLEPSYFSDASASGDDVFFFTSQRLVGQDKDELYDVYDAKVDGGIASQNPAPPAPCEGEGCLGPAVAASAAQSAGTLTFSGSGNEKPKKKHRKKHRKNKHHGKKHHKKSHGKKSHRNAGGNR